MLLYISTRTLPYYASIVYWVCIEYEPPAIRFYFSVRCFVTRVYRAGLIRHAGRVTKRLNSQHGTKGDKWRTMAPNYLPLDICSRNAPFYRPISKCERARTCQERVHLRALFASRDFNVRASKFKRISSSCTSGFSALSNAQRHYQRFHTPKGE